VARQRGGWRAAFATLGPPWCFRLPALLHLQHARTPIQLATLYSTFLALNVFMLILSFFSPMPRLKLAAISVPTSANFLI
jgi:hypothetical protein